MNNYTQDIFYFNDIKTVNVNDNLIKKLQNQQWYRKKIVFNNEIFSINFIINDERIFIQSIDNNNNTVKYKSIFNLNLMNNDKIVEIIDYY
tara:strand:- start:5065 stop:5337 length:273 start_codon:yes stop_codon:yes gene_type:complete